MTVITPPRSLVQRMRALEIANEIRTRRAQLKVDIKAGRVNAANYIESPPAWLETMKVADVLRAQAKWGRVKVHKALHVCAIAPSKTVGGLSPRQRDELVAWIRDGIKP